jgi:hypothetical protein
MCDKRSFEHSEIIGDCCPTDLARAREPSCLEYASTLYQKEFYKPLKRSSPFQAKQLLNVLRPVGINPFLEVSIRNILGKKERGEPTAQEPVVEIHVLEVHQIEAIDRCEPEISFPTRQRVLESG